MSQARSRSRGIRLIAVQAAIGLLAGLLSIFAPSASGEILLVALTPAGAAQLPRVALAQGARLVARGPVDGSLVVREEPGNPAGALLRHGILAIPAGRGGCGPRA